MLTAAETLGADGFVRAARHWRSIADDALATEDAYAAYERRELHVSKSLFGTLRIDGELDLDGGETLLAALDALDRPEADVEGVPGRTPGQRRADHLVQMAADFLAGGDGDATRPEVSTNVVIDLDALVGEACGRHELRRELQHLGPIAQETALRLACDTSVIRAVMAGRSEVLDLGRSTRVVSRGPAPCARAPRRRMRFPGLRPTTGWCDAHHIWHWAKGGPTDLSNLVLLCRHHHVLCHEGGWKLARGPDGSLVVHRPDGSELVLAA